MEQKTVPKLEEELEDAIAGAIVRMGLKKLPLLPSQQTFHLMAKAAVTVYETAVENHRSVGGSKDGRRDEGNSTSTSPADSVGLFCALIFRWPHGPQQSPPPRTTPSPPCCSPFLSADFAPAISMGIPKLTQRAHDARRCLPPRRTLR